jgi:surface antigen
MRTANIACAGRAGLYVVAAIMSAASSGCVAVAPLFMAGATACGVSGECEGTPHNPPLQSRLTEDDRLMADAAAQRAFEGRHDGRWENWSNAASGARGRITMLATYRVVGIDSPFKYCRDYRESVSLGEQTLTYEGRGCRTADGEWIYAPNT